MKRFSTGTVAMLCRQNMATPPGTFASLEFGSGDPIGIPRRRGPGERAPVVTRCRPSPVGERSNTTPSGPNHFISKFR
jgi:hypothetical protein